MDTILGIDLGTTNSVVSVIRDGKAIVLEQDGEKVLPSVVGLDAEGNLLVGAAAQNQWTLAPQRTVRSIKRKMGTDERVQLGDQQYSPQEISAIILRTLKQRAADTLQEEVRRAVITVPAFFNEQQREATRAAGELAGLEVVRIINEPTAASLTYNSSSDGLERLLVYDLGGGTFDVSIVQIEQGVVEVLSSHGDTQLGGDDFDQLLLDYVSEQFLAEHAIDLRELLPARARLLRAVEAAKRRLSFDAYTQLEEEFLIEKEGVPLHLKMELSRIVYEGLIEGLLNKTLVCVDEALADAKLIAPQIDRVILVGGASRTPLVHQLLSDQLGQPIHQEVDPDMCVAMGAAIQGGLISGLDLGPVLVDITPHTLGVGCVGDLHGLMLPYKFAPLIRRNTPLPASRSDVFITRHDGQDAAQISVFQGEHDDVRHNAEVGEFLLEGLADVAAGNEILVRFDLDLDGILKVSATEKATGLEEGLTIENAISRSRADGDEHARRRIDAAFGQTELAPVGQVPADEASSDRGASDPLSATDSPVDASLYNDLPPELAEAIAKARQLLQKSRSLAAEADSQDAEDIAQSCQQLEQAVNERSLKDIHKHAEALDDLLFYLQDA